MFLNEGFFFLMKFSKDLLVVEVFIVENGAF